MTRALESLRRRARGERPSDEGVSIVELVIAMLIFSVVLAAYFGALISMVNTTARAKNSVDASDALRATYNTMEQQVRYATSINRPVQGVSGAWYVEFESTMLPNNMPSMCYQWRLDPTTKVMSYRTWSEDGVTVTAWHGVAWDVESIGAGSPFTFTKASATILAQSLTVGLQATGPSGELLGQQSTTFVARNSSTRSRSNPDDNGDGVSDDQVCVIRMDRP